MSVMSSESRREYASRIHKVLDYINDNIGRDLSLQTLAKVSCFSRFHFHRIFTAQIGETPVDFVKRLRLERAAGMIITRASQSITDIALSCGFSSSSVFARAFKEQFEISPTEWRRKGEQSLERIQKSKKCTAKRTSGKAQPVEKLYFDVDDRTMQIMKKIPLKVAVKTFQRRHVAYVPNLGGYSGDKIREAWSRLCSWAEPLGLLEPPAELIGISFDDPEITPKDKCRSYACVTIPHDLKPPKDIGVLDIPGGRHAVLSFNGTEEEIPLAYVRMFADWLPGSGFEPADNPCFEIYYADPDADPEGKFVMDICVPIQTLS